MKIKKRGFTMIELLIVMAILGILAIALLAAINPIEQMNRGRDTGSRADCKELVGAIGRFYTITEGFYPWQDIKTSPIDVAWKKADSDWVDDALSPVSVLDKLVTQGEIRSQFVQKITDVNYNPLWVYHGPNEDDSTYLCFKPLSTAAANEAETRCLGILPPDFPDTTGTMACANTTDCGTLGNCVCLP